jgi:hypothetical protein
MELDYTREEGGHWSIELGASHTKVFGFVEIAPIL